MLLSSIRFALVMVLGCGVAHPLLATAVGRAVGSRLVSQDIPPELVAAWRADSELSRVRAADGPLVVSEATFAVIREALELAEATGGAFDPTVQPLVEPWGIHGERRMDLPSDDELAAARARVGWTRVVPSRDDAARPTIDAGGTALDLSAIAPGYTVDRIAWSLTRLGIADFMVELGGEVRVQGWGPRGDGWILGVDRPATGLAPGRTLEAAVRLTGGALATSGNYRSAYELDGMQVVHTLDPRSGRPVESDVASATVVAPDCATADGIATQLEALLLVPASGGGFRTVTSSGMGAFLQYAPGSGRPSEAR